MRGDDTQQGGMFSYISAEQRVPKEHPLRAIREIVNAALERLSPRLDELYAAVGRPSIPPERLLRALLLQILYTLRSERQLMEQLDYNILYRWFVGLELDDPVWVPTVFSKNRDRLLTGDIAQAFFDEVLREARRRGLLSDEHFTVDGTLIEAWASQRSFRPLPADPPHGEAQEEGAEGSFRGERRSNRTHRSTTDPEARLFRKSKGKEAKLAYVGHALMDNRHGLAVAGEVTQATGTAEREAALAMIEDLPGTGRVTLGADKAYDVGWFVEALRDNVVTPHVAQNESGRSSAIDGRTTRHAGYEISQKKRKQIEPIFGWAKTVGPMRKVKHRGTALVGWMFTMTLAAYDLVRMVHLPGVT